MNQIVNTKLDQLELFENKFKNLSKIMMPPEQNLYPLDLLATGIINRSLSLIAGFAILIRNKNYIAAAHLVRLYLDNYLRFHAAWLVSDPHDFATKIMKGERINKMKDKKGKCLRDDYLVKIASEEYPWMKKVYDEASGFIHLSKKHIFTSIKSQSEVGHIEFTISKEDKYVTDDSRLEATECMIEITNCVIILLESWIWTKNNSGHLEYLPE